MTQEYYLVTGITGFLGSHVAKQLLEAGHRVRGRVPEDRAPNAENLEFVEVGDLTEAGTFDEAVKGVDYVIHTASPYHYRGTDVHRDYIEPALKGTLGILNSVNEHGSSVKHVVTTSSTVTTWATNPASEEGYTEVDYNDAVIKFFEENPTGMDPFSMYIIGKIKSDKAALAFVQEQPRHFGVTVITPPIIYGPIITKLESLDDVNTSNMHVLGYITGAEKAVFPMRYEFSDVRDIAAAQIKAVKAPGARNKRIIVTSGLHTHGQVVKLLSEKFPQVTFPSLDGVPMEPSGTIASTKLANEVLQGIQYHSIETTITDLVNSVIPKVYQP
ncbi:hypothetical protein BJ742DRAFT_768059 [Cladochytrium replicatum]|nr:hypothetical protein BJ742DRAFT_768059 [Cladochytrium replicatum]